ncbi:hypothetical protein [Pontibacter brevis]
MILLFLQFCIFGEGERAEAFRRLPLNCTWHSLSFLFSQKKHLQHKLEMHHREKGAGIQSRFKQYMDRLQVVPKVKLRRTPTEAVQQTLIAG